MEWSLSTQEKERLRSLASKQAEYAALPVMEARKKQWYAHNDRTPGATPPVIIETWTFDRDFLPENVFECTSQTGKMIETQLLRNIRNHEFINDDKVVPSTYEIYWFTQIDQLGIPIQKTMAGDFQGQEVGYQIHHSLKDLRTDLDKVKPATASVDREKTMAWKAFLESIFGDLLPVEIQSGIISWTGLTSQIVHMMGMEAFFIAMYDTPDELHALMARLRDNALFVLKWAEAEGLLRVNNGNQMCGASSYAFNHKLPAPGMNGHARLCDMWGASDSQESIGIRPKMFREFCLPYYKDVLSPLGRLYWGCCEPADPFWNELKEFPNLKKISISKWCNQKFMGEALQGTDIIFSRKPDPAFLGVAEHLDEAGWAAHVKETLDLTHGVGVEFIYRDAYTVHGNLGKVRRAVDIARGQIQKYYVA